MVFTFDISILAVVADIVDYELTKDYDIILIDRVLHMLINDKKRTAVLKKSDTVTTNGGFILIADTPKHQSLIFSFFGSHPDCWKMIKNKKGFVFAQKLLV